MHTLYAHSIADNEDPYEIIVSCVNSLGSTLFAKTKINSKKKIQFYLKIVTCKPSNYIMDQSRRKNSLAHKGLFLLLYQHQSLELHVSDNNT